MRFTTEVTEGHRESSEGVNGDLIGRSIKWRGFVEGSRIPLQKGIGPGIERTRKRKREDAEDLLSNSASATGTLDSGDLGQVYIIACC